MTPDERAVRVAKTCSHVPPRSEDTRACLDCISSAIRAAVEEEREACSVAALAESCQGKPLCFHGGCVGKRSAARAIRARGQGTGG